jgi:hypothetical protein
VLTEHMRPGFRSVLNPMSHARCSKSFKWRDDQFDDPGGPGWMQTTSRSWRKKLLKRFPQSEFLLIRDEFVGHSGASFFATNSGVHDAFWCATRSERAKPSDTSKRCGSWEHASSSPCQRVMSGRSPICVEMIGTKCRAYNKFTSRRGCRTSELGKAFAKRQL